MSKALGRLEKIYNCIEDIEFILNSADLKITQVLEDKIVKPAIRMNLIRIAEQFSKLKDENEFKILENFSNEDLKGISALDENKTISFSHDLQNT
jgi:uncharacterized protein with HEPN domain